MKAIRRKFRDLSSKQQGKKLQSDFLSNSPSPKRVDGDSYFTSGPCFIERLPNALLELIFGCVCPHAADASLVSEEESLIDDGCPSCDMRDLAHASRVCNRWHLISQKLLYSSVRLDAVHYCNLEAILAPKRKRRSFLDEDPLDVSSQRLKLLLRTISESDDIGPLVLYLKLPYMTRESSKMDMANIVSLLPNLRFVDLPDGVYSDEPSCNVLKVQLQSRCSDIRQMKWAAGSDDSFLDLVERPLWPQLEILRIDGLDINDEDFMSSLSTFKNLKEVSLKNCSWISDLIFLGGGENRQLPVLETLLIDNCPSISAQGIILYLQRAEPQRSLRELGMSRTGVKAIDLATVLEAGPNLRKVSLTEDALRPFPRTESKLLSSPNLETLAYEILDGEQHRGHSTPASSYYSYLSQSLWGGYLPKLRRIFVRDQKFFQSLTRTGGSGTGAWTKSLSIYSRGPDDLEWTLKQVGGSAQSHRRRESDLGNMGVSTRFLSVPDGSPAIARREKFSSGMDLWR